ncbi:MAG: hypothetical protein COA43_11210 [Robiginitomaculum sp.]|nr:MAG: hypothetical protein COA43_11210 [Robiginitomaculum sp.]
MQGHVFMSPYWVFDFALPPQTLDTRREIESFLARTKGQAIVNVFDPRAPYPKRFIGVAGRHSPLGIIPDVRVKAMSASASTLTIVGEAGDIISVGDPIAFTHDGYRYYFKFHDEVKLDGSEQTLSVWLQPLRSFGGENILADRIKPTCRFRVNINNTGGRTGVNRLTSFKLSGKQYSERL